MATSSRGIVAQECLTRVVQETVQEGPGFGTNGTAAQHRRTAADHRSVAHDTANRGLT